MQRNGEFNERFNTFNIQFDIFFVKKDGVSQPKLALSIFGVIFATIIKIYSMKLLFGLIALVMINTECGNNNSDGTKAILNSEQSKIMHDNTTISYEATTRGFYEKIWISKDSISITNDRNHTEKVSMPTPQNEWNELMDILNKIDLQSLPNLEAPTSMRHYDGAPFATLMVTQNKQETKTENFDHGHPPKPIEALVNKVLSMMEMVKKP